MTTPIRAVIFDCFGVLYQGSIDYMYSLAPEDRRTELRDVAHSSDFGYISHEEYVARVSEIIKRDASEVEAIARTRHIRNQAIIELVRATRTQLKTAMLSNVGHDVMNHLFSADELKDLFDVVVLSSDVGMVKPYSEVFEYAAMQLDMHPSECLMVDDLQENVEGAIAAGMKAVQYRSEVQLISDLGMILGKK